MLIHFHLLQIQSISTEFLKLFISETEFWIIQSTIGNLKPSVNIFGADLTEGVLRNINFSMLSPTFRL